MTEFKLLDSSSPLLRQPCRLVGLDDDISSLKTALKNICEENSGIGLAANQIGSALAVFYLNVSGPKWYINPVLLSASDEKTFFGEGCLSFPGEVLVTRRFTKIEISHDGGPDEILTGIEAVAFLHELDHMHGKTMHERKI